MVKILAPGRPALTVAIISGMLVFSVPVVGCGTRSLVGGPTTTRTAKSTAARMTTTITFGKIGDTFGPPPVGVRPALTAQGAWARFAHPRSRSFPIPAGTTVHLGSLTVVIGPAGPHGKVAYKVRGKLAYGYSYHQCPTSQAPGGTIAPNPCIAWAFLNADNGNLIVQTYQTN